MARNRTFSLNLRWRALLKDAGMEPEHLLRQAGLPDDTFSDINRGLTTDEYLRFWRVLEKESDDQAFPLPFVERVSAEVFDPPLFAALCSTHMMQAVQRLAKYKLLIAPMVLETMVVQNGTLTVSPRWLGATEIPASLEVAELAFLLRLNRLATREPVQAVKVTLSQPLTRQQTHHFSAFFGTTIQHGKRATISFAAADALRPFLTVNEGMWQVFEPELQRRLSQLSDQASTAERVHGQRRLYRQYSATSGNEQTHPAAQAGAGGRELSRPCSRLSRSAGSPLSSQYHAFRL